MNLPQMPCARRSGEEVARERILSSFEPIWDSSIKTCKAHWDNLRPNRETGSQDLQTRFVGPHTPEIDAAWSEYDESRLMDAWAASSIKIAFEVISPENTELQKLWRASCRLMKCSPLAIISPRFGLIYDSPGRGQLWPPEFCEAFRALVCHSFWRGNTLSLSTFIQYAVVCRIDDRQPWHMAMNKSSCQDIEAMRSLAACIRQEHIHDVCTTYREFQVARGCHCSLDFDMLYHLGSLVPKPPPGRTQASQVHSVQITDLNTILYALDTFCCNGFPLFAHHTIVTHASTAGRLQKVFPDGRQLRGLHESSYLHEIRMAYRTSPTATKISTFLPPVAHQAQHRKREAREPDVDLTLDDTLPRIMSKRPRRTEECVQTARQGSTQPAFDVFLEGTSPRKTFKNENGTSEQSYNLLHDRVIASVPQSASNEVSGARTPGRKSNAGTTLKEGQRNLSHHERAAPGGNLLGHDQSSQFAASPDQGKRNCNFSKKRRRGQRRPMLHKQAMAGLQ